MIYILKEDDLDYIKQVANIERLCFSEPWSEKALTDEIKKSSSFLLVYLEKDSILGYVGLQTVLDEGYITNIAVLPTQRGKGIAMALLSRLIELGNEKALTFISLEVRESNSNAISLYKKFNFNKVGLRKNFYSKPSEDGIIMTMYY